MAAKRIAREMKELQRADLPAGCRCAPVNAEVSLFEWEASIAGPSDTPFEGGVFELSLTLPNDFPFRAPLVKFKTRVYHCNINAQGGICLDILKNQWSPALSIVKVLLSISSLLADPNPHDPLVPDIAQRFLKDRKLHDKTAREWTLRYAMPKAIEGAAPGPSKSASKGPIECIVIDD